MPQSTCDVEDCDEERYQRRGSYQLAVKANTCLVNKIPLLDTNFLLRTTARRAFLNMIRILEDSFCFLHER